MRIKSPIALLGASAMLMAIAPVSALAQAPATKTLEALTLSDTKVSDSVEISALWAKKIGKADHVLVTTDAVFADSLASGALQGSLKAPLLFVDAKAGLDAQTTKTITELGATKVTILGGMAAIPSSLVDALKKVPGVSSVERIEGESRVETSVAIAKKIGAKDDTVIVARADDYADSLAAGALAARTGYPVVLTTNPYTKAGARGGTEQVNVHPAVAAYLMDAKIKKVLVAGGPTAVADSTVKAIKDLVNDTTRVAGETRRETAVALAKLWNGQGKVTVIDGFAQTNGFQNGFAAALSAAQLGAPVVLTNKGNDLSAGEKALIGPNATGVTGYCGTYVDAGICSQVAAAQGAEVKTVKLEATDPIAGLKVTPTENTTLFADSKQPNRRAYTVTDAKAGVDYTVTLAKAKKDEKGNTVLDLGTDGRPQVTTAKASLGVVNGSVVNSQAPLTSTTVKAIDGQITFSVELSDPNAFGMVIPVVLTKEDGKDKIIAQGGAINVLPEEFEDGYQGTQDGNDTNWDVAYVDKESRVVVLKKGDRQRLMRVKPIDTFYRGITGPNNLVTFDEFLKGISVGDQIVGDPAAGNNNNLLYYRSGSIPSTMVWRNTAPKEPQVYLSSKTPPTQDSITLDLDGLEKNATITVYAAPVPDGNGLGYVRNQASFTIQRTYSSVAVDPSGKAEITVGGLNPDTKYDFAVTQTVGEETSVVGDLGSNDSDTENDDWISTTKKSIPIAIQRVDRFEDKINDGISASGPGELTLHVTLANDLFHDAKEDNQTFDAKKVTVVAKSGGVVTVNRGYVDKNVMTITLNTGLQDSSPDVEYVVKVEQGAMKLPAEKDGHPMGSPNAPAEFTFSYR